MTRILLIFMLSSTVTYSMAQTFKNAFYISPIPHSAALGYEREFKITKKDYSSGRFYFVVSPNVFLSGYGENSYTMDSYVTSSFTQYEIMVPVLLRYELSPYRVLTGSKPGKRDYNFAVFFDAGVSMNYVLSADLHEDINYRDPSTNFEYTFNGSIASTLSNQLSGSYLTVNFGFKFNHIRFMLRHYERFSDLMYKDQSVNWGMPPGVSSFFYSHYLVDSFYQQGITTLCLGYSF